MPGVETGSDLAHLARQKCPRSIDFEAELPRLPTGKLYKGVLREDVPGRRVPL